MVSRRSTIQGVLALAAMVAAGCTAHGENGASLLVPEPSSQAVGIPVSTPDSEACTFSGVAADLDTLREGSDLTVLATVATPGAVSHEGEQAVTSFMVSVQRTISSRTASTPSTLTLITNSGSPDALEPGDYVMLLNSEDGGATYRLVGGRKGLFEVRAGRVTQQCVVYSLTGGKVEATGPGEGSSATAFMLALQARPLPPKR